MTCNQPSNKAPDELRARDFTPEVPVGSDVTKTSKEETPRDRSHRTSAAG